MHTAAVEHSATTEKSVTESHTLLHFEAKRRGKAEGEKRTFQDQNLCRQQQRTKRKVLLAAQVWHGIAQEADTVAAELSCRHWGRL